MFCNLDLRLDVLEQELGLPFSFVSGHIHELQIHVPWTRLNAEPIVITINTIGTILQNYFGLKGDSSFGLEITEKFSYRSRNVDNRKSRTRLGLDKGGLVSKSKTKSNISGRFCNFVTTYFELKYIGVSSRSQNFKFDKSRSRLGLVLVSKFRRLGLGLSKAGIV